MSHLGGLDGMRKFISSGGTANPADSNGTTLADYYRAFSPAGSVIPTSVPQTGLPGNGTGRDLGHGQFGPGVPIYGMDERDYYQRSSAAGEAALEKRRRRARADIEGTEAAIASAKARGSQPDVDNLTEQLARQRAELEKIRSPMAKFLKAQRDQAAAAQETPGAQAEVNKTLVDLRVSGGTAAGP